MAQNNNTNNSKRWFGSLVIVLTIASMAYRILVAQHYEQSTLLFIGLPAVIAIMMINYAGKPSSAYGVAFRGITFFLLLSGIALGEGLVCILFAAPIFYGVAAAIVFIHNRIKEKVNSLIAMPVLLVLIASLSPKHPSQPTTLTVTRIVDSGSTLDDLNKVPDMAMGLPLFFQIGFPKPVGMEGTGLQHEDYRKIHFESSTKGVGTLHFSVQRPAENKVIFKTVSDDSHISHWLAWDEVEVELQTAPDGTKTVTWTTAYRCLLGPTWYFSPLERLAVWLSTHHLIDTYFLNSAIQ